MDWREITKREPRLTILERRIKQHARYYAWFDGDRTPYCANAAWYGTGTFVGMGYKNLLVELIGWGRRLDSDPTLTSSEAYDLAYEHLYDLLPACRYCSCITGRDLIGGDK